jgi:Na+/pantothenate symporter
VAAGLDESLAVLLFDSLAALAVGVHVHVPAFADVSFNDAVHENIMLIAVSAVIIVTAIKVGAGRVSHLVDVLSFDRGRLDFDHFDAGPLDHGCGILGVGFDGDRRLVFSHHATRGKNSG